MLSLTHPHTHTATGFYRLSQRFCVLPPTLRSPPPAGCLGFTSGGAVLRLCVYVCVPAHVVLSVAACILQFAH